MGRSQPNPSLGVQKEAAGKMKKTKTAVIDIDNTLWQFCDALYEKLRKVNRDFPVPSRWTHWDLWEGYCTKEDFFGAVNAIHSDQDNAGYLPYPEAEGFLSALRENGYHITIASHRMPDWRRQTEKWLKKHGLIYDELHLSFQKTKLFNMYTDVVVDDAPQVLEKALENGAMGTGLLFPWNEAYSNNGLKLFRNLKDVLNHILSR
jgi:hypothetical protein